MSKVFTQVQILNFSLEYLLETTSAPLADWGGSELIIRFQAGSIPARRISPTLYRSSR
jgi:hypothetical protein